MKYRVIVTGAAGQLGRDVAEVFRRDGHDVMALDRDQLDITDQQQCEKCIVTFKPHLIVHCAAYTAVDRAESDEDAAYRVNVYGTRNVAVAGEKVGARFIYISTDYVFDGMVTTAYREHDATNPQTVYGKSKLAGELLVQGLTTRWFIVRTSWVFGLHGNNFVKTMLELMQSKPELQIVNDQRGAPTYTVDLANFLYILSKTEKYGIYHASNTGVCTWYEFAQRIADEAKKLEGFQLQARLLPCTTQQFPRPAPRPANSAMEPLAIRANGFAPLRPWREALAEFILEGNGEKARGQ